MCICNLKFTVKYTFRDFKRFDETENEIITKGRISPSSVLLFANGALRLLHCERALSISNQNDSYVFV